MSVGIMIPPEQHGAEELIAIPGTIGGENKPGIHVAMHRTDLYLDGGWWVVWWFRKVKWIASCQQKQSGSQNPYHGADPGTFHILFQVGDP